MMGLTWMELLVIAVVALVAIGPKELPNALRSLGRSLGAARRMAREVRAQLDRLLRESELDELRRQAEDPAGDVEARAMREASGRDGRNER